MNAKLVGGIVAAFAVATAAFVLWPADSTEAVPPSASRSPRSESAGAPSETASGEHRPTSPPSNDVARATEDSGRAEAVDALTGDAIVVPPAPGDERPSAERTDAAPQSNDEPSEELPQTPEWRARKHAALAATVDRQVERLEAELERASRSGDAEQVQRLTVMIERYRAQRARLAPQEP